MDWQDVYDQLRNHNWICYKDGYQTVRMGKTGGNLSFSFSDTGVLFSIAHFEFLPEMRFWKFDQAKQLIILLDINKEPMMQLLPPRLEGTRLVLHDRDSRDIFACVPAIDNGLLLAEAPDAMTINLGQTPINQSSQVIIQVGEPSSPNIRASFLKNTTDFKHCEFGFLSRNFWYELYTNILEHPNWQRIAILNSKWQVENNFFNKLENDRLYVADQFGETSGGQMLDFSVLIGQRAILIEFISTVLLNFDEDKVTTDQLTILAYRYFSNNIVHGREITQLDKFKMSKTWLSMNV